MEFIKTEQTKIVEKDEKSTSTKEGLHKLHQGKLEAKCLKYDEMTKMIDDTSQVYMLAPAKAAGSSLIDFMNSCSNIDTRHFDELDLMKGKLDVLPVLSDHVSTAFKLKNVIRKRNALTVYSHRSEPSRLKSAILHVFQTYLVDSPNPITRKRSEQFLIDHNVTIDSNGTHFFFTEQGLINVIQTQYLEIGYTDTKILKREVFDQIYDDYPYFVIMNFIQASKMQELVANKYCPDNKALKSNEEKHKLIMVRLESDNSTHSLKEWLEAKMNILEWSLHLVDEPADKVDIKLMEKALFDCPAQFVQIKPFL